MLQVARAGSPITEIVLLADQGHPEQHAGVAATAWTVTDGGGSAGPPTVSLAELVDLSGGRLPVGLNPQQHPGPFAATWSTTGTTTVWVAEGALLDAQRQTAAVVTVSGSGLQSPRTLTVTSPAAWQVAPGHVTDTAAALTHYTAARAEHTLWAVVVPLALVVAALVVTALAVAAAARRGARSVSPAVPPRPQAAAPADLH